MSVPYYTNTASASSSPYRPGTADGSWEQAKQPGVGELRPDLYAQLPASTTSSSQLRPEPLQTAAQPSMLGSQMGVYLGPNVVTPRQSAFPRDQVDTSTQFASAGTMDAFGHGAPGAMSTDTPRATHFGVSSALDASKMGMATASHPFDTASGSAWPTMQPQAEGMPYRGYAYPVQTSAGSWSAPGGMSMSQNAIYDTSSSSANTSPNRSQAYYDMSGEHHFDHGGYASHMGAAPAYPMYAASSSKFGGASAYAAAAAQPEYQPEEIDGMLGQVSTLYKTANTKKMAEFYRDKWARMWLTCNYTLKPSIQISIPRTILHESYRRACDAFGLEPLQAASFGKVLRSQFPDVAQRRLGGRGKTRFHYCGFGTSNEREAIKVKSLLEDEKAGKLQLSAGLSAEYASEARAKARSEGQDSETSYRSQRSAEASPGEGHTNTGRALKHEHSPHASSDGSVLGTTGMGTDNRLIASAFATLNSAILTPPGTSSGAGFSGQDALRFSQAQPLSQGQAETAAASSSSTTGFMPRRHTVSHSYSGFSDLGFAPSAHASSEAGDAAGLPSSEVSSFGVGVVSGIAEPPQPGSLLNSPASSLHGYQYIQDPRHMPSSMPFRRSCQDLPDWPTVGGEAGAGSAYGTSTPAAASGGASAGNASLPAESRKAWREYESLCQALLYSIYLGPDPVSFEQRTTLFWTSLSAATRDALHADATLQGMVLRADGIIFRQLLNKLDGMIGDDVADERMPALRSLAKMLAERMAELVRDALPEACATTKVQASQRMGESLERVVRIFEAIRTFREESMLDVGGDVDADAAHAWCAANAGAGSGGGARGLGLGGVVRGNRPRSGTQSSLGSMAGPLANLQLRRRDNSVGSSLSDSQHAWTGSEQRASSSASESEVSSIQSADLGTMPNSLYAPLARKPTSAGGLRARMASHPAPESSTHNTSMALASSQLAAAMPESSPQHFAAPSAPNSRPTTASASAPPPPLAWHDHAMS